MKTDLAGGVELGMKGKCCVPNHKQNLQKEKYIVHSYNKDISFAKVFFSVNGKGTLCKRFV